MRLVLATVALMSAGCDALFNLDHVSGAGDAPGHDATAADGTDAVEPLPPDGMSGSIAFVQVADFSATSASVVAAQFTTTQSKGNTNVIFIGWTTASSLINSVTDQQGNQYVAQQALYLGGLGQVAYVATIGLTGANRIVVQFNQTTSNIDVRAAEYSGLGAFEASGLISGSSMSVTTGPITTTSNHSLVVAGFMVSGAVTMAGPGCTSRRVTNAGNSIEDCERFGASQAEATATQDQNGAYIGAGVAFTAAVP